MEDHEELESIASLRTAQERTGSLIVVSDVGLQKTAVRLKLGRYLSEIWRFRRFAVEHARHKAAVDNDEMFLGRLWTLLEPILRIAMYGVLFGLVLNTSRGIENFIGYLVIGLTYFSMMSRGMSGGSGLIQRSRAMMRTFRFPRATLVIGETLRGFFSNLIPAVLAVIAALLFQSGTPISWTVILVVPLLIMINLFALGIMFFVARITAFLPDAKRMVFFVNRAWFYVSGVFFSVERYANVPELQTAMLNNPAYRFLQAVRGVVMYGQTLAVLDWLILLAWSLGTLVLGFLFFWRAEGRYVHVR